MKVKVMEGQSLLDIAVQTCGTVIAAYTIAALNDISVTDELQAGQVLEVPEPEDRRIADYYKTRNLKPATKLEQKDTVGRVFFEEMPIEFE